MTNNPNQFIRLLANQYNAMQGFAPPVEGHYVPVDKSLAREIAEAYDAMPNTVDNQETRNAYRALSNEVMEQYRLLARYIVFEPWTQEGQPYANSNEMQADVRDNKHLYFFTGGEIHPYLGDFAMFSTSGIALTMNDLFRAVHDIFGHAAEGYQFGARGEENAWIHHSQMFSPLAQRALTTETRGQNSWVNFGPFGYLPATERPFAQQKAVLLPEKYTDWKQALAR